MDDPDAPKLARDVTHARIGNLLHDAREVINDLIALRLNPVGCPLIENEEGEIMAIRNSLNWLLSDIKLANDARAASTPQIRIVRHG